ncbi:MAG TPA: NAD(+) diphosphatase [Rhizobiales bacterium]|nr:NAD(+) diphosphatase [Hyphomicrobiales bacterium]
MNDFSTMGFISAPFERAGEFRADASRFAGLTNDPASRYIMFVDGRPLIDVSGKEAKTAYFSKNQAGGGEPVLIHAGKAKGAILAVDAAAVPAGLPDTIKAIDLRSLAVQAILPGEQLGMLAQARSMLNWHARHGFCANCGAATSPADSGYRRHCPACGSDHFPRVDPVVIMMIRHSDHYLLGRGPNFEENHYSAIAGFVEPGETLEGAVRRETLEETGIYVGKVSYLASQPWPFPSSLMVGMLGEAETTAITLDRRELEDARWFSSREISAMLNEAHPDGLSLPPRMSIAWQMANALVSAGVTSR